MVSHYALPHRGGIEIIVEKLSALMAERGHEIKVVSSKIEQTLARPDAKREFLSVPAFDPLRNHGVHYPLFSPSLLPVIYRAVGWADVVHVQGMLYEGSLLALLLSRLMNRPAVLTEHAGFVHYEKRLFEVVQAIGVNTIGRIALSLSDVIIVPDRIVSDILIGSIGVRAQRIHQIPLGVDADFFCPPSADEKRELRFRLSWDNRPKILFVGNFVDRKRIPLLLEAISNRVEVILCGEGIPPSPLPDNVRVYPAASHEDLLKLYQAADIFVVPSSVETFSIVSFEAMACGLPVVMTDDLKHLTIAKSNLVTFVPANAKRLREAIQSLADQPDQRRNLGQAAAEWVREHFSWERTVVEHLALYESLYRSKHRSQPSAK